MKCPVCREPDLVMTDRQGIEIDYCPTCRGVWLDRGELDKIIDRSAGQFSSAPTPSQRSGERENQQYDDDYHEGKHGRKKRGFLGNLFDFD